jgi:hypothetical protein
MAPYSVCTSQPGEEAEWIENERRRITLYGKRRKTRWKASSLV